MTGPFFPSVDPQTRRLRDQHLPDRLSPAALVELIQDTVGSMFPGATYNDTLGTITLPTSSAPMARIRGTFTNLAVDGLVVHNLTTVNWNVGLDTLTNHGKITIPSGLGGRYLAMAGVLHPAGAAGTRIVSVRNAAGILVAGGLGNASGECRPKCADIVDITAGSVISLGTFTSGAGVTLHSDSDDDVHLTLLKVG